MFHFALTKHIAKREYVFLFAWSILLIVSNLVVIQSTNTWIDEEAKGLDTQLSYYIVSIPPQELSMLAKQHGFSVFPSNDVFISWFSSAYHFKVGEQSMNMYPTQMISRGLTWGIWINTVIFGVGAGFGVLYVNQRKRYVERRQMNKLNTPKKRGDKEEAAARIPVTTEQQVTMFAMFKWRCELPKHIEPQSHFSVTLAKCFNKYQYCSAKYLSSGTLTVTLGALSKNEVEQAIKRLHEVVYQALLAFRGDLSRSAVKCGACFYGEGADQTQVYQIARSSLSIAQNHVWQHIHMLPLNYTLASSLLDAEVHIMEDIRAGRFVLFCQPLFEFKSQDVIQSEALLRVRHKTLGLITAGQFIHKIHHNEHLVELDKAIVKQALKVLSKEPRGFSVSVNLHVVNWSNSVFLSWLIGALKDSGRASDVTLELMINDYYQHKEYFEQFFSSLVLLGTNVVLDHVNKPLDVIQLQRLHSVKGIKLAFELIHGINGCAKRRAVVKQIVGQARKLQVPVYAVGVETQDEFNCIKRLGVDGAQGYFFSAPLLELENSLN
ncbi:EAL domain-containing protein [Pseudoalteromonas umbrosa]|uniref:EAL domain-containing protein n=1 Tax=Pseudoalteromonas umbrosa TaxID=3048489 RepID=UPI0024C26D4B|nr:EAL domain-containing protein [Pseudoalteromonas sp. B95]MDK1289666.1 EAL domain-containing protein [Pseudoalteromonas sp. B95]